MGVQDATAGARKLYVDGVLAASGLAQDGNGTGALRIAAQPGASPNQFFNGTVDDVRLYNLALAQNDAGLLATNLATSAGGIISYAVSGGQLILDWPTSQGWQLQMQTNNLGQGLGTNWSTVIGATPPYTVNLSLTNPTVFYRLTHP